MKTIVPICALVLLVFLCGCTAQHETASQTNTTSNVADQINTTPSDETPVADVAPDVKPGFYRDGADFERVSNVLAGSDANIPVSYTHLTLPTILLV